MRLKLAIIFLFSLCSFGAIAQTQIKLDIQVSDSVNLFENLHKTSSFNSLPQAYTYLNKIINQLQEKGYLTASVDSIALKENHLTAFVFAGAHFQWANLSLSNIPKTILNDIGVAENAWQYQPLRPKQFAALTEKILQNREDNGYPFASLHLDSVEIKNNSVKAALVLTQGMEVKIDGIEIEGAVNVSNDFLYKYIELKPGDLYNESALRVLRKKLNNLPYLRESRPWQFDFNLAESKLKLYLEEKKANQINGLIGIQPNTVETNKFMLTADILLSLKNALSYGESFALTYQQLQYKSPRFTLNANWPYILSTDLGVDGDFELFKRDTTYYRTTFNIGVRYLFNANDYARIYYNQNSNRVFSPDLNYIKANKKLPNNLDIGSRGIGVEYAINHTDYKLSPQKGFEGKIGLLGLSRTIRKNNAITSLEDGSGFDYETLYDSLKSQSYQYRILAQAAFYQKIVKNTILKLGYHGAYLSGAQTFLNELFQIGGFKLLRGFDEESIYANQYHIGTVELRLLLNTNSYFYLFADGGFTQTKYQDFSKNDIPIGLGAGVNLETKGGVFGIAIGIGKHNEQGFQLRQTKIHFGYVAYF